jgi:hypothetical protein
MKKSNNRAPIVFYVSMLLLCAVLISAYMTGDLYAKYSTFAIGGDSARVAIFKVNYTPKVGDTVITELVNLGNIQPGGTSKSIVVEVTNSSEVAVEVKVELTNLTGNLPLTIVKTSGPTMLPPNSNTETQFEFNVYWVKAMPQNGESIEQAQARDLALMGMTDMFELQITVEQVD